MRVALKVIPGGSYTAAAESFPLLHQLSGHSYGAIFLHQRVPTVPKVHEVRADIHPKPG